MGRPARIAYVGRRGSEVRVVDRREGSVRIALPEEGRGGWIEAVHAEIVTH